MAASSEKTSLLKATFTCKDIIIRGVSIESSTNTEDSENTNSNTNTTDNNNNTTTENNTTK